MTIAMIGSGNVATQLGKALHAKGNQITHVYSRSQTNGRFLSDKLGAETVTDLDEIPHTNDLYIIAVTDNAVSDVANKLRVDSGIVVHTSGTVPMAILSVASPNYGVLYPLQTFTKDKDVDFDTVPICVEGSSPNVEQELTNLGMTLSSHVCSFSSEQRKILHVAAVFACNFTNQMIAISDSILASHGLDLDVLRPLIQETLDKIQTASPKNVQTGPAKRGDQEVMFAHLELLTTYPQYQKMYSFVSESINELHHGG